MRTYSGKEIYTKLAKLYQEIKELNEALSTVEDEIGRGSIAYKVLKESFDAKKLELQRAEMQRYELPEEKSVSSLPFE